ncbi:NAD(P)-dependent oxidoreductase [Roseomonas sp. NAR14]|uniref:NAD(P)-dependent oxidoreductase n=1 Tax=Roseomonas acroporae TaxID=2937791 RepID=A0A9X2BTN9_9PROT|nr:NAD(P)-dependent oxidoreductase [Roseomonas acroporae]MCK8784512.1 NAD(P)-dependent oxidoreductase [Roseomonas acroporae]
MSGAASAGAAAPIRRVGFVGIGNMGWPMAARLLGAGFDVTVCDAVPGRAAQFAAELGGTAAEGPAEAAREADAVVTILPTSRHVEEVATAMRGVLRPGAVVIEMSSGAPGVTRRIAESLAADGIGMVDAPVSGGVPRARTGELAIMTGGDPALLARVEPVLRAMGTNITQVGPIGAGQAMKALNNLVSAGGFLIGIEALLIGQRFGLDAAKMVEVLNASTGMNNSTQKKFAQYVLSRRFDSGFGLDLMVKDLSIALEVGRDTQTPTPFAALCRELSAAAQALLGPGQDHTALAQLSEKLAGETLGGNK